MSSVLIKSELKKQFTHWQGFMKTSFLKVFGIYLAANVAMTVGFIVWSHFSTPLLNLSPNFGTENLPLFTIGVAFLPLTLLLEDIGFRWMPWFVITQSLRLHAVYVDENRSWRLWLYRNYRLIYLVSSAAFHTAVHTINIVSADFIGFQIYATVQLIIGLMLARIFLRYGFWESYTVHLSYDLVLIGFVLLSSLWI